MAYHIRSLIIILLWVNLEGGVLAVHVSEDNIDLTFS